MILENKTMTGVVPFVIKGKKFEVFLAEDGAIEIYENEDPGHTGFVFEDKKRVNLFLNALTDIMLKLSEEEE